jgi:hypothetical protein
VLKIVLWAAAGIVVLDVVIAVLVASYAAIDRARGERQLQQRRAMWQLDRQHRSGGPFPWAHRRMRRRRVLAPVLLGAVVLAGSAMANPDARDVVNSALDVIAGHISGRSDDANVSAAAPLTDDESAPVRAAPTYRGEPAGPSPHVHGEETAPAPAASSDEGSGTSNGAAPIAAPTALTATATSSSSIALLWTDTARESGFRLERSGDGGVTWFTIGSTHRNVTTFADTGLPSATTYTYRAVAFDGRMVSTPSNVATATTIVDPPPATTLALTVTSSNQIVLTWSDVASDAGYRVERSIDGGSSWIAVITTDHDVISYADDGLEAGTTYTYRVIAINGGGESPPSAAVSATTDAAAGAPIQPSAEPASN